METQNLNLIYQNTIVRESQFLLIYEFCVNKSLFEKDDKKILNILLKTRILGRSLNHSEFSNQKLDVCVTGIFRPFNFERLSVEHFKFLPNEDIFTKGIEELKHSEKGSYFEQITIELVTKEQEMIKERTNFNGGVWLIDRDWFERTDEVLDELHWIFEYYKTYVEIDRIAGLIRTIDFGWD